MSNESRLIFKGFKDSDFIFYDESSSERYVKIDVLKYLIGEIQDVKESIDILEHDVETLTSNFSDIKTEYKKHDMIFEKMSQIMFELIDVAQKNKNIIKIGYKLDDGPNFFIVFYQLNFESINLISKLEVKMIKENPDLNVILEPCTIDEDYEDIKYFYISDNGK